MSEELKPCPFCNGRPRLVAPVWDLLPYCECLRCGVKTSMSMTNAEAIAAWNRRASPTPEGRGGEREAFEVWAHADHRRIEPEEYEERTPDNNHYYADDSTNDAYVGWCAALLSSPRVEEVRREALEEAAKVVDAMVVETQSLADFPIDPIADMMSGSSGARLKFAILGRIDGLVRLAAAIRALSPPVVKDTP